jgi:hypothetical protein
MSRIVSRIGGIVTAVGVLFLAGCTDIQDDAVERGAQSPAAELQDPAFDTLHAPVPPAPGVEEPSAGEPRTPATPPGTDPGAADPPATEPPGTDPGTT